MQNHYLRVEAVNLDYSVYDTHNISVIRGGSSMLLEAVNKLKNFPGLENVGTGASEGIFKFSASNAQEVKEMEEKVLAQLNADGGHFATFIISTIAANEKDGFTRAVERLKSQARWRQYQQPSFVLPKKTDLDEECFLDRVRPAAEPIPIGMKEQNVSAAVKIRHREGRKIRNQLYRHLLGVEKIEFTQDLETLSTGTDDGALEGKIAFIHLDGNRFGRIRDKLCQTENDLGKFQTLIQEQLQKPALQQILKEATAPKNSAFRTASGEIRLETLMWGGDEIEWVVPASQAWLVLQTFFKQVAGMKFKGVNLTYSAGMVFSHHNLPILQVRKYANQLCDLAKSSLEKDIAKLDETANRFVFLNMTAFDLISRDVEQFLNEFHKPAKAVDFIIAYPEMESLRNSLSNIKRYFPKNKLYEIIDALHSGKSEDEIKKRAFTLISPSHRQTTETALNELLALRANGWFLIADLWPYIGERS